jgi:hypothetical protein
MNHGINCCGFNRDLNKITFLGILTLSLPLSILGSLVFLTLIIPANFIPSARKINERLRLILKADFYLINTTLNINSRCAISGITFSRSPRLSGLIYKYFNIVILILIWFVIILFIRIIFKIL